MKLNGQGKKAVRAGKRDAERNNSGFDFGIKKNGRGRILKRKRSQSVIKRDKEIMEHIENIKAEHPYWGYRRIWAYL